MKIEFITDNEFNIYLSKQYIGDLKIEDRKCVEEYFKKIFMNLKHNYHIDVYGYYNIKVYVNNKYGIVIEVNKFSSEYFQLYSNKVDMKIMIELDDLFLYKISDYFLIDNFKENIKNIYFKDNYYYLEIDDDIDEKKYNYLLECSSIIYGDEAYEIASLSNTL